MCRTRSGFRTARPDRYFPGRPVMQRRLDLLRLGTIFGLRAQHGDAGIIGVGRRMREVRPTWQLRHRIEQIASTAAFDYRRKGRIPVNIIRDVQGIPADRLPRRIIQAKHLAPVIQHRR